MPAAAKVLSVLILVLAGTSALVRLGASDQGTQPKEQTARRARRFRRCPAEELTGDANGGHGRQPFVDGEPARAGVSRAEHVSGRRAEVEAERRSAVVTERLKTLPEATCTPASWPEMSALVCWFGPPLRALPIRRSQ